MSTEVTRTTQFMGSDERSLTERESKRARGREKERDKERERNREKERQREKERKRESKILCVLCVRKPAMMFNLHP